MTTTSTDRAAGIHEGDPTGAEFDGYAKEPPAEPWGYVVDEARPVAYHHPLIPPRLREGYWPFADPAGEYTAVSVRLAPDCRDYAWRNEYVLVWPDKETPYLAEADLDLWVRPQGMGGIVLNCSVRLNLRAGTYEVTRLPEDTPAEVREQSEGKARKLLAYLAAECAARDACERKAPVTASELEAARRARRHEAVRAYCAGHGLTYAPVEFQPEYAVVGGERLMMFQIAAKYIPDLFERTA
jgi:hypothetical protein